VQNRRAVWDEVTFAPPESVLPETAKRLGVKDQLISIFCGECRTSSQDSFAERTPFVSRPLQAVDIDASRNAVSLELLEEETIGDVQDERSITALMS
jgi:hypothetical protein